MSDRSVPLTPHGPQVSRIVAGAMRLTEWALDDAGLARWIEGCLSLGVTTFDHADIYGGGACEAGFGRALALEPGLRDHLQLISKCGIRLASNPDPVKHYDTSRAHITRSVERSLRNLNVERLDLLLLHRPDPLMDFEEINEAFLALKRAGKVRHFGASNFSPAGFEALAAALDHPLVTNQVECSLAHLDRLFDGTLDGLQARGLRPMAWSPLGGGGLLSAGEPLREALDAVAVELDAGADQVALAWLLRHPSGIVPVLGTGKPERIERAVGALGLELSRPPWFRLLEAARGEAVP